MTQILFSLNEKLFVRDPQKTSIGQLLVSKSVEMIDAMGFENFTFKKLAEEIGSAEPTIYRYFENKHRLLHYLIDWYWTIINFRIEYSINNIKSAEERLKICLQLLSGCLKSEVISYLNEQALQRIVMSELDKTYLTKSIDRDNEEGLFGPFKITCGKIAQVVQEINPAYPFPHSLVSTAMQAANHQMFYAMHLPALSDLEDKPIILHEKLYEFLEGFVFNAIKN